ncbi:hypothetical protein Tco_0404341 [Tanacetum coccineum]
MANLKFADTHNMVAFLSKPEESDGFEQIVDFLNAHPIRYALTVNPTIYISCIEQFWSTVKAKTINGEVQLHALVDGKKIIITESTVRRDLQLEDAEGVDCLPNSTIFEQLTLMGSKTTAWNEFSSTMASAIICLATNQKFNFSKFIFEGKAKKSVKLMMEKLFRMELELMLFWSTVKAKTINGEVQLHALVDGKKIIITESTVRRDLQLEDAEGVDCLPNSTIFEQLTLMGSKTTAWNEFSSTMAYTIICLATNQKFSFSKYILESMIRNLDNLSGKFLMYSRFVQVFLDQQLDGLPNHKRIYIAPPHTKKIFGNMRRVGKGFSGRVTPLFQTMVVQNQLELGEGLANPTDPHHTPTIIHSSTRTQKTQKTRKPKRKDTQVPQPSNPSEHVADKVVHKELGDSLATPNESSSLRTTSGGGPRCQETMRDTIARTRRAKKLEKKSRSRTHILKRLYKVGLTARVESFRDEESLGEDASKQGRINAIDGNEEITLVSVQDDVDKETFDVDALNGEEVFVAGQNENVVEEVVDAAQVSTAATTVTITTEEITLAQALEALKTSKSKVKGIVFQEPGKSTTTTTTISSQQSQDKGKGIMIEEHVKPMKKKDQISFDKETGLKLQAEFDEEERLAREKAKK